MQYLIQNHLSRHVFLPIITRDTPDLLPKPDPAGILHIAGEWGLTNRGESLIMVCNKTERWLGLDWMDWLTGRGACRSVIASTI